MNRRTLLSTIVTLTVLVSCNTNGTSRYKDIKGEVFGTYYRFQIDSEIDFSSEIDSVFSAINVAANSYDNTSKISQFNKQGSLKNPTPTFIEMLQMAKEFHQRSDGYFEPTLYPLIKAWGFGNDARKPINPEKIDSLLNLVSFTENIEFNATMVKALKEGVMIDLSALGEGYAIDAICSILEKNGVKNYMVEIGGEMKCKGKNANGQVWRVGIENPENLNERGKSLVHVIELSNVGLSTSGSYRKFLSDSLGNKYSHIIDPKTGYPVAHNLLSASIVSRSLTTADALATACMAMGTEKAIRLIEDNPDIEGFLIYAEGDNFRTWKSKGFPNNIEDRRD
jgi:thiamine biosynthesis lipoprotein